MTQLPASIQSALPPVVFTREWFPHAIAPAFMQGLDLSFLIAGALTAVGAVVSLMRGEKYVHDVHAARAAKDARPAARRSPDHEATENVAGSPPEDSEPR